MYGATYPETWTFALDQRSTHMSLTTTTETEGPVLATPDAVDAVVARFAHTEATPPEVRSLLDVSCMLLRMCVVHYEFAAIAVEKSLQALERALRIHLAAGDKIPFAALVKRLPARGEISEADVDLIDAGRELRNRLFAHPAQAIVLPLVMATGLVASSHRLIGVLFPDASTRAEPPLTSGES